MNSPVYLLIDISNKMKDDTLDAINNALSIVKSCLQGEHRSDIPICIIQFAQTSTVLRPLTSWAQNSEMPTLSSSRQECNADSGFECLYQCITENGIANKDAKLIIVTSGTAPKTQQEEFKKCSFSKIMVITQEKNQLDDFYRSITFIVGEFRDKTAQDYDIFFDESQLDRYAERLQVWHNQILHMEAKKDEDVSRIKAETKEQLDNLEQNLESVEQDKEKLIYANEKKEEELEESERQRQETEKRLQRKALWKEKEAAFAERDAAFQKRDTALQERDNAFAERTAAQLQRDTAMQTEADAVEKQHRAEWQRMVAYIAAVCVVFLAISLSSYFGIIAAAAKLTAAKCDERIATAQAEADKKIKDAETNAADSIAKIEADANKKIVDAKTASEEAIQLANDNANKKIAEYKQKTDEYHAKKVAALEKREDDANMKIDEANKLEKSLKQKIEKQEELAKQFEYQVRHNEEIEKELAVKIRVQEDATVAAEQSKKDYENRLKASGVDIAELNNFKKNFDVIRNGYWHWAGNNQQIPVFGAAKIIERHGGTLVLEDDGNGSTREKLRFNVLIEQLTKEQKALVELLKPNKK